MPPQMLSYSLSYILNIKQKSLIGKNYIDNLFHYLLCKYLFTTMNTEKQSNQHCIDKYRTTSVCQKRNCGCCDWKQSNTD